jgi:shikimate kinase
LKKRSGKKTVGTRARRRVQSRPPRAPRFAGNAVFLVGFMGAGKTTVGRLLGQQLNWAFEDLDDRIELRERRTVPAIFRESGEAEFRRAEHLALRSLMEELAGGALKIVALGGGAFVQKRNAALLKSSGMPTVFLDASVDELWQRCSKQAVETRSQRPLLQSREQFSELHEMRRTFYSAASLKIKTNGRSVEEIACEITEALALKKLEVRVEQGEVE